MRIPVKAAVAAAPLSLLLASCSLMGGGDNESGGDGEPSEDVPPVAHETKWEYAKEESGAEGKATIKVHELEVREKLMYLTLTIDAAQPKGKADFEDWSEVSTASAFELFGTFDPSLVDTDNLNQHSVVQDSNDNELASDSTEVELTFGTPKDVTYVFAPPPEDVETMDLYVNEYAPISDIPVTR